jgi:transketolase
MVGIVVGVVSMPCWELFYEQEQTYKEAVFPKGVPVISVEAMTTLGWSKYAHVSLGLDTFGMSAPAPKIFEKVGLVPDVVAAKTKKVIEHYQTVVPEWKIKPILF